MWLQKEIGINVNGNMASYSVVRGPIEIFSVESELPAEEERQFNWIWNWSREEVFDQIFFRTVCGLWF